MPKPIYIPAIYDFFEAFNIKIDAIENVGDKPLSEECYIVVDQDSIAYSVLEALSELVIIRWVGCVVNASYGNIIQRLGIRVLSL